MFSRAHRGRQKSYHKLTLGQTGTQETGDLLDQSLGSKEGIVLASKLLDELLVLVQLLEVVNGHSIDTVVLSTVEIVLVTKNTIIEYVSACCPDVSEISLIILVGHSGDRFTTESSGTSTRIDGGERGITHQMLMPGRGRLGSLMVPEKRLSRWGS